MGFKFNASAYKSASAGKERFKAGGHRCIIKSITLGKDSTGMKDQFVVNFDTADDDIQPGYFMDRYLESKKWSGVHRITSGNEYFVSNIKKLVTAVEASNDGFVGGKFSADESEFDFRYEDFKDVKVGIVFRDEEYIPQSGVPDGALPTIAKPYYFCNIANVLDAAVPEIRRKEKPEFISASDDEGLPFK